MRTEAVNLASASFDSAKNSLGALYPPVLFLDVLLPLYLRVPFFDWIKEVWGHDPFGSLTTPVPQHNVLQIVVSYSSFQFAFGVFHCRK